MRSEFTSVQQHRSRALPVVLVLLACVLLPTTASAALDDLDLVSRASDGAVGDDYSSQAAISADGRYVAFESYANNLSAEDNDAVVQNVYVRDLLTGATTFASRADGAAGAAGDDLSRSPAISADGRYVAFESFANNLSAEDNDADPNIFLRDLLTGTTTLVSRAAGAAGAAGDNSSLNPAISGDGRHVAFESFASNLSAENNDAFRNIYVRDLQTAATTFVSRADGVAGAAGDQYSWKPTISADGRYVAFESIAANLSDQDTDAVQNVYVRDLLTGATTFVSRASGPAGAAATANSVDPVISADGRHVAFSSSATNLSDENDDAVQNIYARDLLMGATTFVSRAAGAAGAAGDTGSVSPAISADGRFVAFTSAANNFSDQDNDAVDNIFVRDRLTGATTFVSRASGAAGAAGDANSAFPAISADGGRYVAFESRANSLSVQVDLVQDIFRRDVLGTPAADVTPPDTLIDTGPSGPTSDATPTFGFHSTEAGSTFECRIDAGALEACNSGSFTSAPLPDGAHSFAVTATDKAGNEDPTPANRSFTVNTNVPPPTVTTNPGVPLSNQEARLNGTVNPNGAPTTYSFEYGTTIAYGGQTGLRDAGAGTTSVAVFADIDSLTPNTLYHFRLTATNPTGTSSGADRTFTTPGPQPPDPGPPPPGTTTTVSSNPSAVVRLTTVPETTITYGPQGETWFLAQTFRFTSSIAGSTFRCRSGLTGSRFRPCVSPFRTQTLTSGLRSSFAVYAISPKGIADPTPAERTFTIGQKTTFTHSCGEHIALPSFSRGDENSGAYCESPRRECPLTARCTMSSRIEVFDADPGFGYLGGNATAVRTEDPRVDNKFPDSVLTVDECTNYDNAPARFGWDGSVNDHRCAAYSQFSTFGNVASFGRGVVRVYSRCQADLVIKRPLLPIRTKYIPPPTGNDRRRQMTCEFRLTIEPTAPLASVYVPPAAVATQLASVATQRVQVAVPAGGTLSATTTVVRRARASAAAARSPRIAPLRIRVKQAGPVLLKLKLNRSAQALLRRKGSLPVSLRLRFTDDAEGGKPLVRTTKLTIKKPPKRASGTPRRGGGR